MNPFTTIEFDFKKKSLIPSWKKINSAFLLQILLKK